MTMRLPKPVSGDELDTPEAQFRFKWLERDIKEHKDQLDAVSGKVDDLQIKVDKINRNLLIMGSIIIGLGIGSRLFSSDVVDIIKKMAGL